VKKYSRLQWEGFAEKEGLSLEGKREWMMENFKTNNNKYDC